MWLDEHEGSSLAARAFNLQVCHPQDEPSRNNPPARKLPTSRCTLREGMPSPPRAWKESLWLVQPHAKIVPSPCVASSAEARLFVSGNPQAELLDNVHFSALCSKPPNFLPLCLWRGLHHQLAVAELPRALPHTARDKEAVDLRVITPWCHSTSKLAHRRHCCEGLTHDVKACKRFSAKH